MVIFVFVLYFVERARSLTLDQLHDNLRNDRVTEVTFGREEHSLQVKLKDDDSPHTVDYPPDAEGRLYEELEEAGVPYKAAGETVIDVFIEIGRAALWVLLGLVAISVIASLRQYVKKQELDIGNVERPKTRFTDVQGIDEIVARAQEIAAILHDPGPYKKLGARMPKGAILYGPPGTGKTLLARAIAGEAEVPFYRVTAPSLMDKWLGSSAKRIAKLYENARRHGAAIVFIDEIDAIGGRRRNTGHGADEERNAALMQLLTELDGFDKSGVFTIVATNRIDSLDEALTRAGRFDIQLYVPAPDVNGREAILRVHAAGKPLAEDVNLRELARQTTGAVGADLEALVNEAALTAVRDKKEHITTDHFAEALATIEAGPQRRNVTINEAERRITAYHEAGHTLAALLQKDMDDPMRVTIVPRGQSGGHSRVAPEEDRQYTTLRQAKAALTWMMGGRAAEKIACGADNFTSGAASDLQQATGLAQSMICLWGMGTYNTSIPLETWRQSPHAVAVERQVEALLDEAERSAIELLLANATALDSMVAQLLTDETIQGAALRNFANIPPLSGDALDKIHHKHGEVLNSVKISRTAEPALATT
jgi:cell division protease FtsH